MKSMNIYVSDLTKWLINDIALHEGVTPSKVAEVLISKGIRKYEEEGHF